MSSAGIPRFAGSRSEIARVRSERVHAPLRSAASSMPRNMMSRGDQVGTSPTASATRDSTSASPVLVSLAASEAQRSSRASMFSPVLLLAARVAAQDWLIILYRSAGDGSRLYLAAKAVRIFAARSVTAVLRAENLLQ